LYGKVICVAFGCSGQVDNLDELLIQQITAAVERVTPYILKCVLLTHFQVKHLP